jgi:hypothetical protein
VSCLGDCNRVMNEGLWIFRQLGVILEPYDGIADPSSIVLETPHLLLKAELLCICAIPWISR